MYRSIQQCLKLALIRFMINLQGSGKLKEMGKKWLKGGSWIDELH
jgi:hypothetical protein